MTEEERRPAEVFSPGEHLRDEMDERGWTVAELSRRAGVPDADIQAVLDGGLIHARLADRLSYAIGTSADYWANLSLRWKKYGNPQRKGKA